MARKTKSQQAGEVKRILPYDVEPEPEVVSIGNKQTGVVNVPVYGGLQVGEAKALATFARDHAKRRGVSVDKAEKELEEGLQVEGDEAIELAVHLAHIITRSRLNAKATVEDMESLPITILTGLAQVLMQEAAAGNEAAGGSGEATEEGKAIANP